MMLKRLGQAFLAVSLVVTSIFMATGSTTAADRVGAGVILVTPNNNLPYIVDMDPTPNYSQIPIRGPLHAGTSAVWDMQVKNAGTITSDFASYVAPARSDGIGSPVFDWSRNADGTPLAPTNPLTSWTSLSSAEQKGLAPGAVANLKVTINVPADAPNGKYYGVVWSCVKTTPSTGQITMGACAGMRMYVQVTGGSGPDLALANPDVVAYQQAYFANAAALQKYLDLSAISIAAYNTYIQTKTAADKLASDAAGAAAKAAYQNYQATSKAYQAAYQKALASIATT